MIELRDVSKWFGNKNKFQALKNVNVNIERGKLTLIIGSSGSGKTTLLNLIGCLDKPTEGQVIIDGKNVSDLNQNEMCEFRNQNLGYVFQTFFLEPNYSVIENVMMPLTIRGVKLKERKEKALKSIEMLGISLKKNNKTKELSGGERQRVAIARAIIGNPSIILADEPTGNLDSKNGEQVMSILSDLRNAGKTVIVVTHNLDYIKYADKVIRIKDGYAFMGAQDEN